MGNAGTVNESTPKSIITGQEKSDFNQYKPNCLYKYVKFDSEIKVNEMIDILVEDIQNVLRYRDKCENVVSDFLN